MASTLRSLLAIGTTSHTESRHRGKQTERTHKARTVCHCTFLTLSLSVLCVCSVYVSLCALSSDPPSVLCVCVSHPICVCVVCYELGGFRCVLEVVVVCSVANALLSMACIAAEGNGW